METTTDPAFYAVLHERAGSEPYWLFVCTTCAGNAPDEIAVAYPVTQAVKVEDVPDEHLVDSVGLDEQPFARCTCCGLEVFDLEEWRATRPRS
jgi:hypothetical protein